VNDRSIAEGEGKIGKVDKGVERADLARDRRELIEVVDAPGAQSLTPADLVA
jgi:hypothetical protein